MNKENETISDIVAEMKNLVKSNGTKSRTNIPTLTIRSGHGCRSPTASRRRTSVRLPT